MLDSKLIALNFLQIIFLVKVVWKFNYSNYQAIRLLGCATSYIWSMFYIMKGYVYGIPLIIITLFFWFLLFINFSKTFSTSHFLPKEIARSVLFLVLFLLILHIAVSFYVVIIDFQYSTEWITTLVFWIALDQWWNLNI